MNWLEIAKKLLPYAELAIDSVAGLVKASRAKSEAEVEAALAELDTAVARGRELVSALRAELAAGDARIDAAADEKFKDGGKT